MEESIIIQQLYFIIDFYTMRVVWLTGPKPKQTILYSFFFPHTYLHTHGLAVSYKVTCYRCIEAAEEH